MELWIFWTELSRHGGLFLYTQNRSKSFLASGRGRQTALSHACSESAGRAVAGAPSVVGLGSLELCHWNCWSLGATPSPFERVSSNAIKTDGGLANLMVSLFLLTNGCLLTLPLVTALDH